MAENAAVAGGLARELGDGVSVPVLGLGVWQMAEGWETEQAVEWALEAGYRHIDTASLYKNERSVGSAIARSGLPREDVFAGRQEDHCVSACFGSSCYHFVDTPDAFSG